MPPRGMAPGVERGRAAPRLPGRWATGMTGGMTRRGRRREPLRVLGDSRHFNSASVPMPVPDWNTNPCAAQARPVPHRRSVRVPAPRSEKIPAPPEGFFSSFRARCLAAGEGGHSWRGSRVWARPSQAREDTRRRTRGGGHEEGTRTRGHEEDTSLVTRRRTSSAQRHAAARSGTQRFRLAGRGLSAAKPVATE